MARCKRDLIIFLYWGLFGIAVQAGRDVGNVPLWQEGMHPIELYTNKFMKQKVEYIHENPVVAVLFMSHSSMFIVQQ